MNKTESTEKTGIVISTLFIVLKAMAVTAVAMTLLALAITYAGISDAAAEVCITAATFICVFSAGFFTSRRKMRSGWLSGLAAGVLYVLVMLVLGYFIYDGFAIGGDTLKMFALCIISGIAGGITGVNFKKRRKYF